MPGDSKCPTGVEMTCGERLSRGASPTVIETERLVLRPFGDADYDDLFEFLSQLESDEFEGCPGITYENGRTYLAQRVGSDEFLAIELTSEGKVIGNLSCGRRDFEAREVGYIVNERYRWQGYATEALSALIDHVFETGGTPGLRRVRSEERGLVEAPGTGWFASRSAPQAERLLPEGRVRSSDMEGHLRVRTVTRRVGGRML